MVACGCLCGYLRIRENKCSFAPIISPPSHRLIQHTRPGQTVPATVYTNGQTVGATVGRLRLPLWIFLVSGKTYPFCADHFPAISQTYPAHTAGTNRPSYSLNKRPNCRGDRWSPAVAFAGICVTGKTLTPLRRLFPRHLTDLSSTHSRDEPSQLQFKQTAQL